MMREHTNLIVWPSLMAAGLLAAACTDQPNVNVAPMRPTFWVTPPQAQCPTGKWTGGGRIDPPSNPDLVDETSGGQPPRYSPPTTNPLNGKFTFGFNVFLAMNANNRCFVQKGEIEVNGHPFKVAWHVSIHNGVDTFSGDTVFANVFPDGHTSPQGFCLVVGIPDGFMRARVNPGDGRETAQFEVCDNDRGAPQKGKPGPDAMRWRVARTTATDTGPEGDTGLTYLTGGNVVEHGGS